MSAFLRKNPPKLSTVRCLPALNFASPELAGTFSNALHELNSYNTTTVMQTTQTNTNKINSSSNTIAKTNATAQPNKSGFTSEISVALLDILKTMVSLEKSYGIDYLTTLLRGDTTRIKSESHAKIEAFGEYYALGYHGTAALVQRAVDMNYLRFAGRNMTLRISLLGMEFLEKSHEVHVRTAQLRRTVYQKQVYKQLKEVRNALATAKGLKAYELFSNFSLDRIADKMPTTLKSLVEVPGLSLSVARQHGEALIALVQAAKAQQQEDRQLALIKRVASPGMQFTKQQVAKLRPLEEIAQMRDVKPSTALGYIRDLSKAGEIDALYYIQSTVPDRKLFMHTRFITNNPDLSMEETIAKLQSDRATVGLCKLFLSCEKAAEAQAEATQEAAA